MGFYPPSGQIVEINAWTLESGTWRQVLQQTIILPTAHHDILLNASHSSFDLFVEDVSKICECCDEISNGIIIAEFSIFIVLLCIEFSRYSGGLELALQDQE